jgi:hypothetical protein
MSPFLGILFPKIPKNKPRIFSGACKKDPLVHIYIGFRGRPLSENAFLGSIRDDPPVRPINREKVITPASRTEHRIEVIPSVC